MPLSAALCSDGPHQVAAKIAGRDQGRGQHFGIGQASAWVGRPGPHGPGAGKQFIEEAVHCNGLFAHVLK